MGQLYRVRQCLEPALDTRLLLYTAAGFFDTVTVGQMVVPDQFVAVSETTLSGFGSDGGLGYV